MKKLITLLITHTAMLAIGFAAGVFALPILIAPPAPDTATIEAAADNTLYTGEFTRDRADSDFLHWGEGTVSITADAVMFVGDLAPGPDYRLYFSPEYVETEAAFNDLKSQMVQAGPVNTFSNFVVPIPSDIDPADYGTVIVWCETFGEFITSTRYDVSKP